MQKSIFSKVFLWMFVGLFVTFATGIYVSTNENMIYNIFSTSAYWIIFIAELLLVIFLSARIHKMSLTTAIFSFLGYSVLSGLTFSSIFLLFNVSSIIFIFAVTSVLFLIFGLIGYYTNIDLSKMGIILLFGLLGIILVSVVNIFLGNPTLDLIISVIAVIIFVGFIAYDIQRIKAFSNVIDDENKVAIIGALELYLDFINLFIHLISIFGDRRN